MHSSPAPAQNPSSSSPGPAPAAPRLPQSLLRRLWLAEAVRQTEERTGWLDDEQANRQARAQASSFAERLLWRAGLLAWRDGLAEAQSAWLGAAVLAALAVMALAVASGLGLAWTALDGMNAAAGAEGLTINVYRALLALLGLHALTLLLWLAGMALGGRRAGAEDGARLSGLPGRVFLWLGERLSRDARRAHVGAALASVLRRAGLLRWLLGIFSHGFWLLALGTALLALLLMMSTRRYGFVWESTLLDGATLGVLTQAIGHLPGLLGFPVPAAADVAASGLGAAGGQVNPVNTVNQQWALWLVGVVLVYGLLPRLLLLAWCLARWRWGLRRLRLDEDLPGYRLLRARLMPAGEAVGVSDAAPPTLDAAQVASAAPGGQGRVLYAVELGADHEWPPAVPDGLTGDVHDGGRLDSGGQRQRALDQLARAPAERLLVACDPRRSPDRGTLRLLVALAQQTGQARVWLLAPPDGPADVDRLSDWHDALAAAGLALAPPQPLAWLEQGGADAAPATTPAAASPDSTIR
ncbi:MAG: DUF2868 domain-containing protein [Comamonas sp.]